MHSIPSPSNMDRNRPTLATDMLTIALTQESNMKQEVIMTGAEDVNHAMSNVLSVLGRITEHVSRSRSCLRCSG